MGHRSNDQSCTKHRTIPSTTSTMKIAILSLVLVAAVSIDGAVLKGNGMTNIHEIIETIDNMSKGATDLNTMEARLQGLSGKKDTIDSAFAALKDNLDKTKLGTNSENNEHVNKKMINPANEKEGWEDVPT